uniref:Uncharacterized protein n=1 Tax=Arundo donax TaxID=35708 RepID=A0A0A9GRL5_ARUDO
MLMILLAISILEASTTCIDQIARVYM